MEQMFAGLVADAGYFNLDEETLLAEAQAAGAASSAARVALKAALDVANLVSSLCVVSIKSN